MSANKDILEGFWKLGEAKENQRIDAAFKIINQVKVSILKLLSVNSNCCEHNIFLQHCKDDKTTDYVLARLVKGTASSKPNTRQGFFMGLVEILRQTPREPQDLMQKINDILDEQLKGKSSKSVRKINYKS